MGFRVEDLKKVSKKHECTINDLICAVFGTALRAYLDKNEEQANIPKEGKFVIPVNTRPTPKTILEMRAGHNENNGLLICLPYSGDFRSTLARIKQQVEDFKNSHRLYMLPAFVTLAAIIFPSFTKSVWMPKMYESMQVNLTNVCGSDVPL